MKSTKLIMGMPITVEVVDTTSEAPLTATFDYFTKVDKRFSTYKPQSEISRINRGLPEEKWSDEMKHVLELCEQTKRQTDGYFDIEHDGKLDPSGLVKGWAIHNAAKLISSMGYRNFYIEAGGDIQVGGVNAEGKPWLVGIRNPFNLEQIIKILQVGDEGVATSGTYVRGEHIYNPKAKPPKVSTVKSLTVVGPNIYEADRFATAAFAMDTDGIAFLERLPGFEAYMVDNNQIATFTSGFLDYVAKTD